MDKSGDKATVIEFVVNMFEKIFEWYCIVDGFLDLKMFGRKEEVGVGSGFKGFDWT